MNGNIDFLGIGAARCGTTWLYSRFKELSDFTLPYKKEFHYFDRDTYNERSLYTITNELGETSLLKRLKDRHFVNRSIYNIYKTLKNRDLKQFSWQLKWYYSNYSDSWYLSMFNSLQGITGEITPSYAILSDNNFQKMHKLLPDIKIIYLIRNPIDRDWSNYKFSLNFKRGNNNTNKLDINEILEFIKSDEERLSSNYIKTIDNFQKRYGNNQILIGIYDAIIEQPEKLLSGIVSFLNGDPSKISEECDIEEKNNVSRKMEIPLEIKEYLKERYAPMLKELSFRYGGYCKKWADELGFLNKQNNNNELKKLNPGYIIL